jgi:hypothetical protein
MILFGWAFFERNGMVLKRIIPYSILIKERVYVYICDEGLLHGSLNGRRVEAI